MLPIRDLSVHEEGKAIIRELYPQLEDSKNPRMISHIDRGRGLLIRQKTDLYEFTNYFLEKFSVYHNRVIGGPFQAFADGCNTYCYYYPRAGKIIWTKLTKESIQKLADLIQQYKFNKQRTKYIPNEGYLTKGYIINVWIYLDWMRNYCDVIETAPRRL